MLRRLTFFALLTFAVVTTASAQSPPSMPGMPSMPAGMVMLTPDEMKWGDGPAALPPGVKIAMLEGNPAQPGAFAYRLKFPANYKVPAHTHPADEHVTVISGTFYAGHGTKLSEAESKAFPPGGFFIATAKTPHFAWSKEETVVQVHGVGPSGITYVDPADDPRKK